ncbi:hypothetical protein [Xanthomonas arboricola]|uniref:hypothetical protein n=1 Tax=Xanthomonas arboricola TaxID=56448 RepID=UPI00178DBAF6
MPKISFAAHISPREAIERRSRSPYLPGAARTDVTHLPQDGNTHAMIAEVDDDEGNLPANCRPLECARKCRSQLVAAAAALRALLCSAATSPDAGAHPDADGRFPLYRE